MRALIVLGLLVVLSAASAAQPQQSGSVQLPPPGVVEVEKLKDNLFVLQRRRRQHRRLRHQHAASWSSTPRYPGLGPAAPRQDQGADAIKPVTTIINTHTHGDHVGGNVDFPATVDIVVHENTKANMEPMDRRGRARRARDLLGIFKTTRAGGCRSGPSRTG